MIDLNDLEFQVIKYQNTLTNHVNRMQYYKHADSTICHIAIFVLDTKHHHRKLRKVTIITVTNYKYNYNTMKPKLKNEPQNEKKLVHRCSFHFKYIKEHNKESSSLARCGLIIIPLRLNILSTGPIRRENLRRDQNACNLR